MIEQSHRKIATVFAILILCTTPTLAVYHPAYAATSTGIMIPLYSYPGSYWTQVIQVKNAYPSVPIAVIVNPNNGPGSSIDQNYVTGIQQLQAAGVIVLGYVYTHYGARSTSSVEADINAWNSWYHVNGINFDEMANTAGYESYYSGLSSYAKSLGMTLTVGNPGTSTISSYVGTVDVLDIYESSGMPSASQLQSYTFNGAYPKSNFAFIGYGVSSLPSLATITTDSNYVAWMYITDNGGSNPYNNVPSYLSTEVSLLATVDGTGGTTTTAPSAPTGLTASAASSSQINLSWTAPSSNGGSAITGYEIDRSANAGSTWTTIASNTGSTSTTYSDTGLAASTAYTYRVSAINAVGTSSPSGTATATTQAGTPTATAPGSPTGLTASAASSSQINLSWTAPSSNGGSAITGYEIDRSANAGSTWTIISSNTGSTGTTYSDTGLASSTTYTYRVSSINAIGTSTPSGTASATTSAASTGASPTGIVIPLYVYPGSEWTQIVQEKQAHPSVPIIAIINPSNGPGSSFDSNYLSGVQQLQSAGVKVLGYVYTHYGARSQSSEEADINSYNTWYHVNGIFFDEMANTAGYESYYTTLSNYVHSDGMSYTMGNPGTSTVSSYVGTVDNLMIYESSGLPSVSTIAANTFGDASSGFSFIAYGVGVPSQSYLASVSPYVSYLYITDAGGSNPYNTLPSYYDTEVAELDTGSSSGSGSSTSPSSPTGLTATAISTSQINLSWTAPSSNGGSAITGYEIDRSANAGSTWTTIASNTGSTSTTYSDTGLAASTAYTYRVSAINAVGTSSPSGTATATTQAGSGGSTGGTTGSIAISGIQSTSGTVSASPYQLTLANVNAGTGSNRVLVVGVEANNNNVISVTFGGTSLTKEVSSFANNDAEFWYLVNPTGTGNVVVTMAGSTSAVVGAYSLSGVDQANPIPTSTTNHNTSPGSPTVSITTANPNSLVLDSPSIWGGVTLGSPTCTQGWDANMPSAVTGASSSISTTSAGAVTCSWTASGSGDLWDDVAIEVKASGATSTTGGTTNTVPSAPTGLTASAASSSQINLSWTAPSSNGGSAITGYEIDRSANAGSTWTTIASNTGSTSTTYSDTGLAASTAYTYRVSAINAVGTSSPSGTATATTQAGTTPAPTGGSTVSLTVSSDNLGGSQFSGMWVELHAANGTTLATGYTPVTFSVTSGVQYVVYAANYQSNVFNHWQDGTTNSSLTITPTQNTSLTAYYSTAVTLTVKSVDLSGNAFSGMWTVVKSGGNTVATGYTPFQYAAQSGNTYTITVDNYQNYVFSHWSDGSTNPTRTVTPTQDTTLVAYYST